MSKPKFNIHRSGDGQYYFNLVAANHDVILTSELYTALHNARSGINSVRANAPLTAHFDRRTSSRNEPYFVLRAANHEVIGTSEMYSSAQARDAGILAVQSAAAEAEVVVVE